MSQVCKVLESLNRKHILKHLKSNKIFSDRQHGIRVGKSCLSNLLEAIEKWTEILDEYNAIDVAYLDFSNAFDLVSHKHLLYKISKYGNNKQVLNGVTAFLLTANKRAVFNDCLRKEQKRKGRIVIIGKTMKMRMRYYQGT